MSDIDWNLYTHHELWDKVTGGPGVAASQDTHAAWAETEQQLADIDRELAATTRRLTDGWEGTAAEATRTGLTPLGEWVTTSVATARSGAASLVDQADQVSWVRNSLPPPEAVPAPTALNRGIYERPGAAPPPAGYQLFDQAATARRAEAKAQAVHIMNAYTLNTEIAQRPLIPAPPPPQVTAAGVAATPSAGVGMSKRVRNGGTGSGGASSPVESPTSLAKGSDGAAVSTGSTGPTGAGPGPVTGAPGTTGTRSGTTGIGPGGLGGRPGVTTPPAGAGSTGLGRGGGLDDSSTRGTGYGSVPGYTAPGAGAGTGLVEANRPGQLRPMPPGGPGASSWRTDPNIVGRPTGGEPSTSRGTVPRGATEGNGRPVSAAPEELRPSNGRPVGSTGAPMMPMGAGAAGQQAQGHRRPSYLIDDSGAFADDRWFTEAVITPDDPLPRARAG